MSKSSKGEKDNSECASLRPGNLPQSEEVREVDPEANAGKALACVHKQNVSDQNDKAINVPPVGRDFPTVVSPD